MSSLALRRGATNEGDARLDQLARDLRRDGICVVRGLFDPALIDDWYAEFTALFKKRQARPGGLAPREKARFYLTFPWEKPFADAGVFANPVILGVLNRAFAQEYHLVQLAADIPFQGSEYQEAHRDFRPLFDDRFETPLYALAVNFPLVDVHADNGPFQMARGTHRLPKDEGFARLAAGEVEMESFPMRRGDVMIRSPLALHRGTPNTTPQPRPMVVMGYVMHWLRTPKVDLTLPRAYYDSLPPTVRDMLRCDVVDRLREDVVETYKDFKY
jgi:ectoine hydroxylase-related dioxygenase (phytanoyl-CoA dioxygenase family)